MRDGALQSSAAPRDRFSTAGGSDAARAAGSGDDGQYISFMATARYDFPLLCDKCVEVFFCFFEKLF